MRRLSYICFCLIILLQPSISKAEQIVLSYAQWKPIFYIDDAGETVGIYRDIFDAVFVKGLGMTVSYDELPWSRAQKNVRTGASDMMITVPTDERLTYAAQSADPFFQLYLHVMTYAGHKDMEAINNIKSVEDILALNLTVGSNLGNGWIKQNIEKQGVPVYYVSDDENILTFLKSRRPDITIDVPASMNLVIDEMGYQSDIVITPARFGPVNFHLMISNKSKHLKLITEINRIFANLVAEGRIDAILRKYKAIQ